FVCDSATYTYSVQRSPDATSYSWTLPAGWAGTPVDTFITVTTGTTGGTIIVNAVNGCGTSADQTLVVTSSQLSVNFTSTPPTCPGGTNATATATAANGTIPYTYSWNTIPVQNTA